jgi:hypothetical protein
VSEKPPLWKRIVSWMLTPFWIITLSLMATMRITNIPGVKWIDENILRPWVIWNDEYLMEEDVSVAKDTNEN